MWIIFALSASVLWGLTYVVDEQIYKKISVLTSLSITSLFAFIVTIVLSYALGSLQPDFAAIASSKRLLIFLIIDVVTLIAAELFIGFSIVKSDATLAGLIEISYPIFIALFAYLFFKENELNMITAIGGTLIFLGVFIIYFFNK